MIDNLRDIKPNNRNPRSIKKERMEKLQEYITEYGDLSGLVVNADGTTISGHQRSRVFKKEKGKLVILERYEPAQADGTTARGFIELKDGSRFVYREVDWPQDKADKATIIANGQFGDWDSDILTNEWEFDIPELREFGVPEFVFGDAETNGGEVLEAQEGEYEMPDEIKTDIVAGDLFEIGPHRLLCGDSTSSDDVARLMDGQKADMVFTDPPYALFGNSTGVAGVTDDKMVRPFFLRIFEEIRRNTKQFGHIYACCDWHSAFSIESTFRQVGLTAKNLCIWDKGDGGLGAMYQQCYEMIWFLANSPTSKKVIGKAGMSGERCVNGKPNIWRYSRVNSNREHTAQKPEEMVGFAIENSSDRGELVIDLFLGSGTTMVAAHQLNRKCYGMELDPKYCQVIVDRMLKLDPELEIKRNGKPYQKTGE